MIKRQQHYPQWWKIESISPKVRNKTRVPTFTTTILHSFGSFHHSNQSRKRNKRNPNWKRSETLTVCRWHDPLQQSVQLSSTESLSHVRLFATPWIAAYQASLSITISRSSLKLAIQPSHPLSSPSSPAPNPSHHQGLFQWVSSLHEVAKVLELQL